MALFKISQVLGEKSKNLQRMQPNTGIKKEDKDMLKKELNLRDLPENIKKDLSKVKKNFTVNNGQGNIPSQEYAPTILEYYASLNEKGELNPDERYYYETHKEYCCYSLNDVYMKAAENIMQELKKLEESDDQQALNKIKYMGYGTYASEEAYKIFMKAISDVKAMGDEFRKENASYLASMDSFSGGINYYVMLRAYLIYTKERELCEALCKYTKDPYKGI